MALRLLQTAPALLLCTVVSVTTCVTAFQPSLTLNYGPHHSRQLSSWPKTSCTSARKPATTIPGFRSLKPGLRACRTPSEPLLAVVPAHSVHHSSTNDLVHSSRRTLSLTAILSALILWIGCNGIQDGKCSAKELVAQNIVQSVRVHDVEHRWARNSLSARIHVADGAAALAGDSLPIMSETRKTDFHERRDLGLKVALALLASIPLGIVASVLLIGGFSIGGVWGYLAMGVGAFLAAVRFVPRVQRLSFRLDDFLNSDFAKIFDFWKLLDSALDRDKSTTTVSRGYQVEKMTEDKETKLPAADPMWTAMNKDLWGAQERVRLLEDALQEAQEENFLLRARIAVLEEEAEKRGEREGGGGEARSSAS